MYNLGAVGAPVFVQMLYWLQAFAVAQLGCQICAKQSNVNTKNRNSRNETECLNVIYFYSFLASRFAQIDLLFQVA